MTMKKLTIVVATLKCMYVSEPYFFFFNTTPTIDDHESDVSDQDIRTHRYHRSSIRSVKNAE